ncbi:MAG: chromosome segregation ATPase [Cyclobacteriaceae bacterium]|jgi:chromosome segregation ATPase
MSNEVLRTEINSLQRKIKLLLSEYTHLQSEVVELKGENNQLKARVLEKEANIESFQNKVKISKIVKSVVDGDKTSPELKEVIDEYIKEIDKCIAHLGEA